MDQEQRDHRHMATQLKFPESDVEFRPSPVFFLGPFNVYDREESLGQHLNLYDPNDSAQLRQLLDVHFFPVWSRNGATVSHKLAIAEVLIASLRDPHYSFAALLEGDEDCFSLPSDWDIRDPREFFYEAYLALLVHWGGEICATGILLPAAEGLRHGR